MKSLPWHHVHITLSDREAAAKLHEQYTPAERTPPTKRSENLFCKPNLLQIQSKPVAPEPLNGRIESIGIGVLNLNQVVSKWKAAGGFIDNLTPNTAELRDPWGVKFEFTDNLNIGYTHINIAVPEPEKLCRWYESNLGGIRKKCEWDDSRFVLAYDTMLIMFISIQSPILNTTEHYIDHLGWFTEDLDVTYQQLSANDVCFPVLPRKYDLVRLAFAEDPFGNWIELLEPPDGKISKQT